MHSPNTRGWQSVKFSEYPQELGFELVGANEFRISQVQILSHQSKIAKKIEIFIGSGPNYHSASFKRLGYLSLDSNERSSFQARELKTVYIDYAGKYIRLVIHENYVNKQNLFNQVGIVAVNFLGSEETTASLLQPGNSAHRPQIPGGGYRDPSPAYNPFNDLAIDMNLDPQTATKLRLLSDAKTRAINGEDYVTAKAIKAIEGELKVLGSRLAQLDIAKRQAVETEDYDRAKEIKEETDELRGAIEKKILSTNIPGMFDNRQIPVGQRYSSKKPADDVDEDYHEEQARKNASPLNIDDMPVGPGTAMAQPGAAKPRGPSRFDEDEYANDSELYPNFNDRPIRPKERSTYDDRDPIIGETDEPDRFREDVYAPGQHPLEGVANLSDLPAPEELTGKSRDTSEQSGITNLIGAYRARCLFSKTWALREAAISKVQMMLKGFCDEAPGIDKCLSTLCTVVRVGIEDKIQQVLFGSVALMEELLSATREAKISRPVIAPLMDPVLTDLIEKLADGNARIRDGARKGIDLLAASPNIGSAVVGAHALRVLPAKQKTAWRPIMARLQLLTDLVIDHGVGGNSGLGTDAVMSFIKNYGAFGHSNGEVRDAAKDLTVAVQRTVGTPALEGYLKALRPKQLEEYLAAFDSSPGAGAQPKKAPVERLAREEKDRKAPRSPRTNKNSVMHSPGGRVNTSAVRAGDKESFQDEPTDFTTCTFCRASDKAWDEEALDVHYWKDCPLLVPCPACAQVVEIAGLPEHLLEECEQKINYVSCDVTGLAIRKNELSAWRNNPSCKTALTGNMYCPLCVAQVADSDDAWIGHLSRSCPKNARTK